MQELKMSKDEQEIARSINLAKLRSFFDGRTCEELISVTRTWCWLPHRLDELKYLNRDLRTQCAQSLIAKARLDALHKEELTEAFRVSALATPEDFIDAFRLCRAYFLLEQSHGCNHTATLDRFDGLLKKMDEDRDEVISTQARLTYGLNKELGRLADERKKLLCLAQYLTDLDHDQSLPRPLPTDIVVDHFYQIGDYVIVWRYGDSRDPLLARTMRIARVKDPRASSYQEMIVESINEPQLHFDLPTIVVPRVNGEYATELVPYSHVLPWSLYEYYRDDYEILLEHYRLTKSPDLETLINYFKAKKVSR